MRLSRKSEYALLALIDLARHYGNADPPKIVEVAERNDIPKKYLEQIFLQLKGAGYVRSIRGSKGGYELAKSPDQITLAEIIRLIDGPLASVGSASLYFFEHTPIEKNEKLLQVFKEIRDFVADKLENLTISQFVQ
ncbi:transcriptional regulator, BadM/Rrf2 family [Thermoclostridium stercorarium subsp. stercorarium DSM 8532]|jgi:Rrf2 family cysteine metabolism transcriptional repressor|uniref:Transcriptional regulator, BadM/Rrf2 family n=3 Tax=Thermoclostridium stercorarium TaxID=1510 RepID=L7VKM1_THES1|nr:Rrf2 family transcriptional regulator [Thermoclostridium stercorarium]AGC67209.1 transcriptional regulator, BadM/Rrf2 family [Thermoclostridium stercorarium subsp. stercorarium DSM 8532]AGI38285.1 transcriptional regulator [Thermoclostridium stercorarium subsp. stercorarium DSM 8532]ANW97677.1 Rrf2 family transcriptional regulator [Thermoclostridium stercorarium subsp. thermolacticum DSM 2910]ANX00240.1 Rrf2 family transcriptional regulator [Thermoclostridium stercorarium subsp. leptospartum